MAAGRLAELWFESGPAYATFDGVSLTEITKAQDITEEDSRGEIPEADRATVANGTSLGQRTYSVTCNYHYAGGTDTTYDAIRTAYTGRTTINMAACDGPIGTAGTRYIWFEAHVTQCPRAFPLEGSQSVPMKFVLAVAANLAEGTISA